MTGRNFAKFAGHETPFSGTLMNDRRIAFFAFAALALAPCPAAAHPHVFAEARLDILASPSGEVTALRNLWRFDDVFSSTVLVEFDKNADLKLDADELASVGNTVRESLAEFDYFQVVSRDGKSVAIRAPDRLIADFQDNQLIIMFEAAPVQALPLSGDLSFGVYDPTFYTAIDFVEDDYLAIDGMPAGCSRKVVRPDPDEALAQNQQTLTDAFFNDPAGTDYSKIFATRLELSCKPG